MLEFDTATYQECQLLRTAGLGEYPDSIVEVKLARWPVITAGPEDLKIRLNQEVQAWAKQFVGEMNAPCAGSVKTFAAQHANGGPFITHVAYKVSVNNNGLFTLQMTARREPCCGLNGNSIETKCWNIDINKGTALKFTDIVRPSQTKAFVKLIEKKEKTAILHPDSADDSQAFDFLVEPNRIKVFFHEEWGGKKFYTEVRARYLEEQLIYQPEFLELVDLECRFREDIALNRKVYVRVDHPPSYPGGDEALLKVMRRELAYTDMFAKEETLVQFVVEADGWVSNASVIKSPSARAEKEALRILKRMDRWNAGRCYGKEVPVLHKMSIKNRN